MRAAARAASTRRPGALARLAALEAARLAGGVVLLRSGSARSRARGLAGVHRLPPGWALELPRCRSVHTFGMRFDLDLVWLGPDGRPVRVSRQVPPRRVRSCRAARSVVEVAAGGAEALVRALATRVEPAGQAPRGVRRPSTRRPRPGR